MGLPGSDVWGCAVERACGLRGAFLVDDGVRFEVGEMVSSVNPVMALTMLKVRRVVE
tara:strand:+ start:254 stop:424 length:171 start_codon:yes stop_codon:yes gene_type:complete